MKVVTVFTILYSVLARKPYWRNFSLGSILGRMEPLQAIGFISFMKTMNHVRLLPWATEKLSVTCVVLFYKGG